MVLALRKVEVLKVLRYGLKILNIMKSPMYGPKIVNVLQRLKGFSPKEC